MFDEGGDVPEQAVEEIMSELPVQGEDRKILRNRLMQYVGDDSVPQLILTLERDRLKDERERIQQEMTGLARKIQEIDRSIEWIDEKLDAGPIKDEVLDDALEKLSEIEPEKRTINNEAIRLRAREVGMPVEEFLEELNERYPYEPDLRVLQRDETPDGESVPGDSDE